MQPIASSYRDPAGFVFEEEGRLFRFIDSRYEVHYSRLLQSGLYGELVKKGWLIPHKETPNDAAHSSGGRVIEPERIPFISYPYEWSFNMWQDAALLTLQIASAALKYGMVLKDATPFNIQFIKGRPVFIDTLSFENYEEGSHWVAYRQFCECFLAPLLLMHYSHPETGKLFIVYPNGIPLNVLTGLLPGRAKWNVNTFLHIYLQAKLSAGNKKRNAAPAEFSKQKLDVLLKGLTGFVQKLQVKKRKTTWDDYYTGTVLGGDYVKAKTALVLSYLGEIEFETAIDLGANDGHFSLLLNNAERVIAVDADANCINDLYLKIKREKINNVLPLLTDLVNPSPATGWNNAERDPISQRLKADLVLALALVHHLAIANNIPLSFIAGWLAPMAGYLIIEFVPKSDEKVKLLLQNRQDIFTGYTEEGFKEAFAAKYHFLKEQKTGNTGRILFLMKRR